MAVIQLTCLYCDYSWKSYDFKEYSACPICGDGSIRAYRVSDKIDYYEDPKKKDTK